MIKEESIGGAGVAPPSLTPEAVAAGGQALWSHPQLQKALRASRSLSQGFPAEDKPVHSSLWRLQQPARGWKGEKLPRGSLHPHTQRACPLMGPRGIQPPEGSGLRTIALSLNLSIYALGTQLEGLCSARALRFLIKL